MRMILVLAITVACTSVADAWPCRRRVVRQVRAVVQAVPVVQPQTFFLVSPPSYYGAPAYQPPQQSSSVQSDTTTLLTRLVTSVENLETSMLDLGQRVNALEGVRSGPHQPTADSGPGDTPSVLTQTCGKCHGGGAEKGGFALSQLASPQKRMLALSKVANGEMPLDADGNHLRLAPEVRLQLMGALKN